MFIRTFVQVCAYHFGYSVGSSSFSFNVVEGKNFQKKLKESKQSVEIFRQTERILLYVRKRLESCTVMTCVHSQRPQHFFQYSNFLFAIPVLWMTMQRVP